MGDNINIDGVRFKVEADLSKLEADLKKGEGITKKSFGRIESQGTGAFSKIKDSAANAFKSVEDVANGSGSKLLGVLGKIGAAGAIAFGVGKIVAWGKAAVESAEAADKAAGRSAESVSAKYTKASEAVGKSWENITNAIGKALLPVAQGIYNAFAGVLNAVASVSNAIAIALTNTRDALFTVGEAAKKDVNEFNKLGQGLKDLKVGTEEFAKARDSIIEQSDKLNIKIQGEIDSNEKLLAVYKKLSKAKMDSLEATSSTLGAEESQLKNEYFKITGENFIKETPAQRLERLKKTGEGRGAARSLTPEQRRRAAEIRAQLPEISRNLESVNTAKFRLGTGFIEAEKTKPGEGGGGSDNFQEERFLDSRQRLNMIAANKEYTIKKALSDKLTDEEFERRKGMAEESARQDSETELNTLRHGYAQFIEDNTQAKMIALTIEHDNAIRLSNLRLEAELRGVEDNEEERARLIKENDDRITKAREANARKQAAITLQSMADNLNAAKDIAGGVNALGNSRDAGSALGATGGILGGLGKFSPFSALKDLGPVVGAVGGVASALTSLFGKSDEERAREAAEAQRVAQEQVKLLELQANYTKNILALQEQAAKLPFESLQRKLRLIDITSQQERLSGGDETTINAKRLQSRQSAIDETTRSQTGAIGGGQLFAGTDGSAGGLIQFLNERGAQSVAVSQFVAGFQNISQDLANRSIGDAQIAQLNSYRGKIPTAFFGPLDSFIQSRESAIQQIAAAKAKFEGSKSFTDAQVNADNLKNVATSVLASFGNSFTGSTNAINTLGSEITSDTGIAESMVSLLEQSQQNQLEIAANTKKTADNTTKLVETPQRQSSIIDISRGYTRSLGQILNPGITNTALPSSVQAAVLATDIQKSIQERSLDKLQNIETIQRDSRELLAIIAKGVNTNASGSLLAELESLYRRSIAA